MLVEPPATPELGPFDGAAPLGNSLCIIAAVNDDESLEKNLLRSDMVQDGSVPVHVERGASSASIAYNRGLDATDASVVIFAHQDVYFPPNWLDLLTTAIRETEKVDPDWALIAPFGMDLQGRHIGQVWSTSLGAVIGQAVSRPEPVQSFDELVIVMRRDAGLRFDDTMPMFHLYGTDIVLSARARGLNAYVCHLPVVHNDGFHDRLRADFAHAYHFLRKKWARALPVRTPVLWVTKSGLGLAKYRFRAWRSVQKRRSFAHDTGTDPKVYSAKCGWESN